MDVFRQNLNGDFGSGFPDYNGTVPRSATLVITREDGGVIGA